MAIELAKIGILAKVESEFKKRGLDVVYEDEIEEYKKYQREKLKSKEIEDQMIEEIKRFVDSR